MNPPLAGKVVVIIGGTTGIGFAAGTACIAAGARVVAVGLDDESCKAAQAQWGQDAHFLIADAREEDTAEGAIDIALDYFGEVHALYHVAGGSGRKYGDGPVHELTDEGWTSTLDLNLTSLMYSNRAAVRQFLKQGGGGSILNLSSVLAWRPSPRHFTTHAYAAAKAGIIGFSQSLASAYAANDIRVNVLAPGLVDTPMARRAAGDPVIQNFIQHKQPLAGGRIGQPEDLAGAAVFFLSDQSRFCTGQVLAVDGGWSVSEGPGPV